jgi:hypothetical protein
MSREVPPRALQATLDDAQERLIDSVCGPRWAPVGSRPAPIARPRCEVAEDFARKRTRTRKRTLHTAAGTVELVLWHVGCREADSHLTIHTSHAQSTPVTRCQTSIT